MCLRDTYVISYSEAIRELGVQDNLDELAQRLGVEFMAANLSLELPRFAVNVEDALAEEVFEGLVEIVSVAVVVEVDIEDVLDDGWVCRLGPGEWQIFGGGRGC